MAAPTAGLHFSQKILKTLSEKGVIVVPVTLHVGLGTFLPIKTEYIADHTMHREYYSISEDAAFKINDATAKGNKVLCVGTTAIRVLETVADGSGMVHAGEGWTDSYIYPSYQFKCVRNVLTNFHLPDSTLILLVAALLGTDTLKKAYTHAIDKQYRFFSYGDCMLILE